MTVIVPMWVCLCGARNRLRDLTNNGLPVVPTSNSVTPTQAKP